MNPIGQLKERLREGYPVDIQDLASLFTMDSATEFLFVHGIHSLSAGISYPYYTPLSLTASANNHLANRFARAFDEAQKQAALRARRGVLFKGRRKVLGIVKIQSRLRKFRRGSLLDYLVKLTDDKTILRDETLNILLAGRDTTTSSMTFCVYMLAENPLVLKKLREEIMEKVGNHRPTYSDMREMKYLRAVINETIRLYPAVRVVPSPMNVRTSKKPALLPNKNGRPFYIPAGSRMPFTVFLMHRRHDLWGPDADIFDPDRLIEERLKKYLTPNPFIFLPFNAGPRICLGQQFAYHETSYFLIRLLQQFSSISIDLGAQPSWAAPPPEWRNGVGTQKTDKIRMKNYVTMSVVVRVVQSIVLRFYLISFLNLRAASGCGWKSLLIKITQKNENFEDVKILYVLLCTLLRDAKCPWATCYEILIYLCVRSQGLFMLQSRALVHEQLNSLLSQTRTQSLSWLSTSLSLLACVPAIQVAAGLLDFLVCREASLFISCLQ
ncbi:Cytochrome P450 52A6 [Leucoagaricus sp. SymC.cos]|nr:Cytochrome P450 52A6 [Leucoagaricus sp. SymC.cos]